MNKLLYVETSIPSFYFDTRTDPLMVARRKWTRLWWSLPKPGTDLVTGFPVHAELDRAPSPKRERALQLIRDLEILPPDPEIDEIVSVYLTHQLMPAEALGDAHHLALASYHRCDILVTWNCKHIANANKLPHIRRVNALLGLETPALVTPLELLENDDESET
jgi:predicted nucleic acid-binding protein